MKKFSFILIIGICLFPNIIKAYSFNCENSDRDRLQKLANNISYVVEETDEGKFKITFTGVSKDLRIFNNRYLYYYHSSILDDFGEVTEEELLEGHTYTFQVKGEIKCPFVTLRTLTVSIPKHNPYYNHELCKDIPEFNLCQKWTTTNLTDEQFSTKVNEYKENKKKNQTVEEKTNESTFDFFTFYKKYYWFLLSGLIVILGLLVFLWNKQNKKNKI